MSENVISFTNSYIKLVTNTNAYHKLVDKLVSQRKSFQELVKIWFFAQSFHQAYEFHFNLTVRLVGRVFLPGRLLLRFFTLHTGALLPLFPSSLILPIHN